MRSFDVHSDLYLLQRMEDCGVALDTRTLNCVVDALHGGGQPDLVLSLVQHMKSVRQPLHKHCTSPDAAQ
jgi:hypothetical protein